MQINISSIRHLKQLTETYRFSILSGDLIILDNNWYVTHTGLLRLALRRQMLGHKC